LVIVLTSSGSLELGHSGQVAGLRPASAAA